MPFIANHLILHSGHLYQRGEPIFEGSMTVEELETLVKHRAVTEVAYVDMNFRLPEDHRSYVKLPNRSVEGG